MIPKYVFIITFIIGVIMGIIGYNEKIEKGKLGKWLRITGSIITGFSFAFYISNIV